MKKMRFLQYRLPLLLAKNDLDTGKEICKFTIIAIIFFTGALSIFKLTFGSAVSISFFIGFILHLFLVSRIVMKGVSYDTNELHMSDRARELLSVIAGTEKGDIYLLVPNITHENIKRFDDDKVELINDIARALLPSNGFHGRVKVAGLPVLNKKNDAGIDVEFLKMLFKVVNPEIRYAELKDL